MKSSKNLLIVGRRWFQRSYGNIYHTFEIKDMYNMCVIFKSDIIYGYDNQYRDSARAWLKENGYSLDQLEYMVYDVPCKKDL